MSRHSSHNSLRRGFLPIGSVLLLLAATGASAADPDQLAEGGRIYDNWWKVLGLEEPGETHSAYPAEGKKSGSSTWRCKECHGWDYRGAEGAYASGSHFTGITGIRASAGADANTVKAVLSDATHGYDKVMDDAALTSVATFVSTGQFDMDQVIDRKTRSAKGDAARGEASFEEYCEECHGEDGRELNFKPGAEKPQYLGTLAAKNPWEVLHKTRNGQPGATREPRQTPSSPEATQSEGEDRVREHMPPMLDKLSESEEADLLSYLQKLPKE